MKTATLEQLPLRWPEILRWVSAGEEVQITDHDKAVARVLPPAAAAPDFLHRATSIWGSAPDGANLSTLVDEARTGR